ncbi:acetate--CoA ligase [Hymenobacter defluvii]|uniref:Acetate--CoA ligase n=1 Tax=Hymenobacter defluvii TaxID=2054411 RepID=A0ABS3T8J6_9BACT|nr:acetate--CoA ligase [Hymenobacter defluvii]MBO3269518.1 acetate--CoA ligase [Hymenobacter defluvii]
MPTDHPRIRTTEEYQYAYRRSVENPEQFWADVAEPFTWRRKWDTVLTADLVEGHNKWYEGAKLNITENCLDRHLSTRGNKLALIWEPNDPKIRQIRYTYRELHQEVCRFANVLHNNGVEKGDRVCLYMPMIPQLAIAVLACARIGAVHSVIFAGFSANAIADRVNDAQATVVITADGLERGAKQIPVKRVVDEALEHCPSVRGVIVVEHLGWPVHMKDGRDVWYHDEVQEVEKTCPAEEMDAEDPLFILYTSGSTGKPKGVVHTTAGYMVWADYTFRNVFQVEENDVYWCSADIGWVTGHTYLLYGPLLSGATTLMFEGVPTYPSPGRYWEVIDKHGVNVFYTSPTAIRSLMAHDINHVLAYSLDSLRVLGSVGEPINEEAWHWYHTHIGKGRCPIVDTWWQTETGGIMISALANITPSVPARAGLPLPGVQPVLLNQEGQEIEGNDVEGYLAIKAPWPGIIRTTYGDHERAKQTYFGVYPGYYFTGDGARREADGLYRIQGRVDDVINVSGHRFGTAEIENAINQNNTVVESAVVGYPHDVKGQGIYAYVICRDGACDDDISRKHVEASIIETIVAEIGRIAKPDKIQFVEGLPKTRSGKIMRRILRKVAEGDTSNLGDITTLLDPEIVEKIVEGRK